MDNNELDDEPYGQTYLQFRWRLETWRRLHFGDIDWRFIIRAVAFTPFIIVIWLLGVISTVWDWIENR